LRHLVSETQVGLMGFHQTPQSLRDRLIHALNSLILFAGVSPSCGPCVANHVVAKRLRAWPYIS
jgi:hypothetical protein